jgi:hypothetical protein
LQFFWGDNVFINKRENLGGTNLPAFPVEMVAIVTLAEDCMSFNHNNPTIKNPKPLMCKAKNHAPN